MPLAGIAAELLHFVSQFANVSWKRLVVVNAEATSIATLVEYAPDENVAAWGPTSLSAGVHENAPVAAANDALAMPEKETSAAVPVPSTSAVTVKDTVSPAVTGSVGAPVTVKTTFCASSSVVTEIGVESGESP